jgi:alpha-N-arabinofuranosidase
MAIAKEYDVAKNGNDRNKGTLKSPFLSIQAAANVAQPGDIITVHEGIYREWITPPAVGSRKRKGSFIRSQKVKKWK